MAVRGRAEEIETPLCRGWHGEIGDLRYDTSSSHGHQGSPSRGDEQGGSERVVDPGGHRGAVQGPRGTVRGEQVLTRPTAGQGGLREMLHRHTRVDEENLRAQNSGQVYLGEDAGQTKGAPVAHPLEALSSC